MSDIDSLENNELRKVLTTLKRYKFHEKIARCYQEDIKLLNITGINMMDNIGKVAPPWELETFLILSIYAKEWKFDDLGRKKFVDIMNEIHNYCPLKAIDENVQCKDKNMEIK